jgi:hypothetical protein
LPVARGGATDGGSFGRGHGQRRGAVRLNAGQRQLQGRKAPLPLDDPHRKLHAGDVAIVGVLSLEHHVAIQRVRDRGLYALDEILLIDGAVDRVPIKCCEGHDPPAAL